MFHSQKKCSICLDTYVFFFLVLVSLFGHSIFYAVTFLSPNAVGKVKEMRSKPFIFSWSDRYDFRLSPMIYMTRREILLSDMMESLVPHNIPLPRVTIPTCVNNFSQFVTNNVEIEEVSREIWSKGSVTKDRTNIDTSWCKSYGGIHLSLPIMLDGWTVQYS